MTPDRLDRLLTEAEARAESLLDRESYDAEALGTLEDLADVADEAADLLATVDVRELVDALDVGELPDAVELDEVPEAIEERAPRKAVKLRKLLALADLSQVLDSTDVRQFRREKHELSDELDDLTADGDGRAGAADPGEDAESGDGGGVLRGLDAGDVLDDADLDGAERTELTEAAVQSKIQDAVGEFREGLLAAHERLAGMREENQERTPSVDRQPSSASPTAFSTMPAERGDLGDATRHSTVPERVRHSDAMARDRVYGDRFPEGDDDA